MTEPLIPSEELIPNRAAFERVYKELQAGAPLTFEMVGDTFGKAFWMLLVYALMDSGDASRAIMGAINRLRKGERGH